MLEALCTGGIYIYIYLLDIPLPHFLFLFASHLSNSRHLILQIVGDVTMCVTSGQHKARAGDGTLSPVTRAKTLYQGSD